VANGTLSQKEQTGALKFAVLLLVLSFTPRAAPASDPAEFFETRIRPLLANNCFACHTNTRMGGLQLDSREHVLKGGNSGPAIVAGKPEESLLIRAVTQTHERLKMPPGGKLKDAEIANLAAWIKAGAIWPERNSARPDKSFWAFQPVRNPPKWTKNGIDRFVLAKLESRGLKPVRPADKRVLIRRATFDLTGLPPTPDEVNAFLRDRSPDAFAKVIDRLLASPRYGERWGRYWLDVARYSDDKLDSTGETPYPNSFRYRDWVIKAFNDDMPYDLLVKAQIAGDLLDSKDPTQYTPGLGFYALSPEFQDDRVDATTRGFLALTVACAQCHDHKYDPIPTKDYYSLLGVFTSTKYHEVPLARHDIVEAYQARKQKIEKQEAAIKEFAQTQSTQLAEILASKTAQYMLASCKLAPSDGLDSETLERWTKYLNNPEKEHPYLKGCGTGPEFEKLAKDFQTLVLSVNAEKKLIDEKNRIRLGLNPDRSTLSQASLLSLERDKYVLWRDLFERVLFYGEKNIGRFLHGEWKDHLAAMRAELAALKKALPPQYPFLQAIQDSNKPANERVHIRGSRENLGEEAPRHFLTVLCNGEPKPFTKDSGRLELAEAIASRENPLTARVMVNRMWQHHFGQGIVGTPSNFGQLGDRPSHPELLDYLAWRFMESGWSMKALHREIMLSATYALSTEHSVKDFAEDPENRLLWRANRQRLDAEALRDSLLFVAGNLDLTIGGAAARLTDDNRRRAVYGYVSRKKLDSMLSLFDFPNPNSTSERRMATNVPLQRLFFLNSGLMTQQAKALSDRLNAEPDDRARIRRAYQLLFSREAREREIQLGLEFLRESNGAWPQYAQVLLSANEFSFVN
jgi:mono/diheme cytochrome c family protein